MKLRTGRKLGRTVYIQMGDEPSDNDELLGLIIDPARAALLVLIVNGESPPLQHYPDVSGGGVPYDPADFDIEPQIGGVDVEPYG